MQKQLCKHSSHQHHWSSTQFTPASLSSHHHHWSSAPFTPASLIINRVHASITEFTLPSLIIRMVHTSITDSLRKLERWIPLSDLKWALIVEEYLLKATQLVSNLSEAASCSFHFPGSYDDLEHFLGSYTNRDSTRQETLGCFQAVFMFIQVWGIRCVSEIFEALWMVSSWVLGSPF